MQGWAQFEALIWLRMLLACICALVVAFFLAQAEGKPKTKYISVDEMRNIINDASNGIGRGKQPPSPKDRPCRASHRAVPLRHRTLSCGEAASCSAEGHRAGGTGDGLQLPHR